jgi:glycosyltransferase involved in cell wall biosynthesis
VDILQRYNDRLTWTSARDHGQTDAINKGLHACSGDIVAYLNSDDVYFPDALATVAAYFTAHPECLILYGTAHHLHADGSYMEAYATEPWNYERLFETCYLCQPAVFWRRELHAQFGYFDERLHFGMDYEFWLRIGAQVPFHHLAGAPLAGSRLHADTKTLSQRVPAHREILQVVRRHAREPRQTYNWLRHLASLTAQDAGLLPSPDPEQHRRHVHAYVTNVLRIAGELRIELDPPQLQELESMMKPLPVLP